jgi:hypothetical protein
MVKTEGTINAKRTEINPHSRAETKRRRRSESVANETNTLKLDVNQLLSQLYERLDAKEGKAH